jgi:hypothetical protein
MTAKKNEAKPETAASPAPAADNTGAITKVVVTEEPVRRGGYVLGEDGWIPEDN